LKVQNNETTISISGNGTFSFPGRFSNGMPYDVSILSQPAGETCTLGSNDKGNVPGANVVVPILCSSPGPSSKVGVLTYHYDNARTGWNQSETILTTTNVNPANFGILSQTSLPDNADVDAQPLVVPSQKITMGAPSGQIDVPGQYALIVYVATEANDIYAINANTGQVVLSANLGQPVAGPFGISSTPVIDLAANTMYVVAYTLDSQNNRIYQVHALDLGNLTDKIVPPPDTSQVANTATDVVNTSIPFQASLQRQKPALLESNGKLYAGFGSLGDNQGARGWVLGWNVPSLTPLANNQLNNRLSTNLSTIFHGQPNSPSGLFLSSVWMSGYGIAADSATGDLYFVTGNSAVDVSDVNPSPSNLDLAGEIRQLGFVLLSEYQGFPNYGNVADSVVRLRPDLSGIDDGGNAATGILGNPKEGIFTPWMQNGRSVKDYDFGSGGAMLLPEQTGSHPHLLAAAGKEGVMYLLDRDQLGGFGQPSVYGLVGAEDDALAEVSIGPCWCGPSYFNSGSPYVVSSGGNSVELWGVSASALFVALTLEGISVPVVGGSTSGQGTGFMTSVSSNGAQNAIIWAVSRPDAKSQSWLYAFNAQPNNGTLPLLFNQPVSGPLGGNSNVVPVVANGKVFVATNGNLTILGLQSGPSPPSPPPHPRVSAPLAWGHRLTGTVVSIEGHVLHIETREKRIVTVDATAAMTQQRAYMGLNVGGPITAFGDYDAKGVLRAETVLRANNYPAWPMDR
jgi:hypothetical protein